MNTSLKLGRLFGVPFGLHWSWFIIFFLVTGSLSAGYLRMTAPGQTNTAYWVLGVTTSLLFFLSVVGHEVGHAVVAQRLGIPVRSITLFIFGGVAQIAHEPRRPGEELQIAIAGPLVSLACGLLFGALWLIFRPIALLAAPLDWLARINLALVAFNLIPAFPLDGGRVLRAILWKTTHSFGRATRFSSFGSRIVAVGFIGVGIFSGFKGNMLNGLWLVFIGWFLQNTAMAINDQTGLQEMLGHVKVAHVMSKEYQLVPGWVTLNQLIRGYVLAQGNHIFFVAQDDRLVGMVSLKDIAAVPRSRWDEATAFDVMIPIDHVVQVHPDTTLLTAMTAMDDAHLAQVPVMQGEQVTGLLSREQALRFLRLRMEPGTQSHQ